MLEPALVVAPGEVAARVDAAALLAVQGAGGDDLGQLEQGPELIGLLQRRVEDAALIVDLDTRVALAQLAYPAQAGLHVGRGPVGSKAGAHDVLQLSAQ